MNTGIFGEGFPYSNFHDLNLDWIIKIAKDFLDQYTHIQEVISDGEESIQNLTADGIAQLEEKATALENALQNWYDEHSEDIADELASALGDLNDWYTEHSQDIAGELADALADLNSWYTTHQGYLDQYLTDSISAFNTAAEQKAAETIATIPSDYSTLAAQVNNIEDNAKRIFVYDERGTNPIDMFYDIAINNAVDGKVYWIQLTKNSTTPLQQLVLFRTTAADPTGYEAFANLVYVDNASNFHTGIRTYKGIFNNNRGENITVIINWDLVSDGVTYNYYPNQYVFNPFVFKGGLIYQFIERAVQRVPIYQKWGTNPVDIFYDFSIDNAVSGKLYWLQVIKNSGTPLQQLVLFRTTEDDPTGFDSFVNFVYIENASQFHTGIHSYKGSLNTGEIFNLIINWTMVPDLSMYSYDPTVYVLNDLVFNGGLIKQFIQKEEPDNIYWAACGDSITNGNHATIYNIPTTDPFMPFDGYQDVDTYKRKVYAYYIAKKYNLKWANYGYGGTTLHHCAPKAYALTHNLNPFVDSRIENLKAGIDWDYITIFFGWNDCAFGPIYQRDLWLQETYQQDIGYPVTPEQIGAEGFADATQKAACDAATGYVGDVYYDNTSEYFFARFIGLITDNVKNTWYGAWNYAIDYLQRKYQKSRIMIVAPFVAEHSAVVRQAVHNIANKWGLLCFDFNDLPYWYWKNPPINTAFAPSVGNWATPNGTTWNNTIEGFNISRFSYDGLHPSNLGYETFAKPFGELLING